VLYRNLTNQEINQLEIQGCKAENWTNILVDHKFEAGFVENVRFAGQIKIASGVRICNVGLLQNYEIKKGVRIENTLSLSVEGETSFGNGTEIDVLNEGGGRELPLFDTLSSQIAYMLVNYRYDETFITNLKKIINQYTVSKKSQSGVIGEKTFILNSGTIKNVNIGSHAVIEDTLRLEEGTIVSNSEAPVRIGEGIIAKHFIVQSGSTINEGALLTHCFVGQAVSMGKQFSGENSAFFANSEAFHSEACSIFAGPYTVTHHKSTLLIAGMFSFYNAGSGTNQSNHMYKLGPLHQGVLERGAKTGSFSYMLWPSYISAYSAVIGKHYTNFDISEFPFSYVTEEDGRSILTPAMNLFTVGTKRDSAKWPKRDKRTDSVKHDLIHFDLFNPYIVGRIVKGINKLTELYDNTARDKEYIVYKGVHIKRLMLRQAVKFYKIALNIYIGEELIRQIEAYPGVSFEDLKQEITPKNALMCEWYDLSGMFISSKSRESLLNAIRSGEIANIDKINDKIQEIFRNYRKESWEWCVALIELQQGSSFAELGKNDFAKMIENWKNSAVKLNNMILNDAGKEFDESSIISYGMDGCNEAARKDFKVVRGCLDSNSFVIGLKEDSQKIQLKADLLLAGLEF